MQQPPQRCNLRTHTDTVLPKVLHRNVERDDILHNGALLEPARRADRERRAEPAKDAAVCRDGDRRRHAAAVYMPTRLRSAM